MTQDAATETTGPIAVDTHPTTQGPDVPGRGPSNGQVQSTSQVEPAGCTQAQLRRFIKSRPYVPMHELRRRFELNGQPDDVSPIDGPDGVMYVGLPGRESSFVAELLRQGDIGVELCRVSSVPIVVGVFPIRPVTR